MEILGLNLLKSLIIIIGMLLYWKFVYYKYHEAPGGPLNFIVWMTIFGLAGAYGLLISKTLIFQNFKIVFIIFALCYFLGTILVYTATKKHGLTKGIEITYNWIYRHTGKFFVYLMLVLIYPILFFTIAGTSFILGPEHVILWTMIFLAWIRSGYKLAKNYILK